MDINHVISLIENKPFVIKQLYELLSQWIAQKGKGYLNDTINHYMNSLKYLYFSTSTIRKLLKVCKKTNQLEQCQKLLSVFMKHTDLIYDHKLFIFNIYELVNIFLNIKSIVFDFGKENCKLDENNKTWNNLIKFMNDNNIFKSRNLRLYKIEIKNLPLNRFPSNKFLSKILYDIQQTKWNLYFGIHQQRENKKALMFLKENVMNFNPNKSKHIYGYHLAQPSTSNQSNSFHHKLRHRKLFS